MTRKAISVVQTEWHPNKTKNPDAVGWAPFDGSHGSFYLGVVDSVFLFAYAFAMFGSGHLGDRMNLTHLLTIGMLGTGIFTALLGFPYYINLHALPFFVIVQLIGGIFQSIGWPTVVAIMTKWFGKGNRGLIFGIWNAHTSIGNILGAVIPGAFVGTQWGLSFIVPGLMIAVMGVIVFFFLPSDPSEVDATPPQHHLPDNRNKHKNTERDKLLKRSPSPGSMSTSIQKPDSDDENENDVMQSTLSQELTRNSEPIGLLGALTIPGVIEFSFSLFFAKLVAYTFLYWLPYYVKHALGAKGVQVTDEQAADLSTFFDVGGIGGGILIGYLADRMRMNAVPCVIMQLLCIPELIFYNKYGGTSYAFCIGLSFLTGFLVNGPYSLITTAVSADLATHKVLKNNQEAKATVAAIIDGTGSIGAALGPLLAGVISGEWGSWSDVFYLLMIACGLAALLLVRLVVKELKALKKRCEIPSD
jgi:OPA family glycerol-3-phosphate transporter-like MFS transporter 1/2